MARLLITCTNAMAYQFLIPLIYMLVDEGHVVELACTNLPKFDALLKSRLIGKYDIPVKYVRLNRSPYRISNIIGYRDLVRIINNGNYDVISTNEPVMSVATRLAARKAKKGGTCVLYTAHGFHFFKGAPIVNWLLYYPVERWLSRYTDVLITINKEDCERAGKRFNAKKTVLVPGVGLDTEKFRAIVSDREEKRKELGIPVDAIVLLSVGELSKRKNHETIVRAVSKLKNRSIFYVICGKGSLEGYLRDLAKSLGLESQLILAGYRRDTAEIYKASDIFAFPSRQEGLPVALMEAMAAGTPIVCSNIRGNMDLVKDGEGGYLKDPNDADGFALSISKLIENSELRKSMGLFNQEEVKRYDISVVLEKMRQLYADAVKCKN